MRKRKQLARYDSKMFGVYLDSDLVWDYIEMGKDIDELYPEHLKNEIVTTSREKLLKYVLLENEKYYFFANDDYILTDLGRVYNCKLKRFIAPEIQVNEILVNIRNFKYKFSVMFQTNNWNWDYNIILQNYKTNNWHHNIYYKQ